jgi:hypothetical protein
MRTNPLAGNTRDWQNAPHWQKPHTRSPTAKFETPSPTASTTPANSVPGVKGRGGWINKNYKKLDKDQYMMIRLFMNIEHASMSNKSSRMTKDTRHTLV